MKITRGLLIISAFVVILTSCRKTPDDPTSVKRNWNFVSISADLQVVTEREEGGKQYKKVLSTAYTTTQNGGNIAFDDTKATSSELTYTVDTTQTTKFYENNSLVHTEVERHRFVIPGAGRSSGYQRLSLDSLYLNEGLVMFRAGVMITRPVTLTLKFEGDILRMIYDLEFINRRTVNGVEEIETEIIKAQLILKR